MLGLIMIAVVAVVLSIGIGVIIDRATWIGRLSQWPIRNMPGTNGAIFGVLLIGVMILTVVAAFGLSL